MPQNFIRPVDVDQGFLLPVDMREWLPEEDLCFFVRDVVAALDLSAFYGSYRANGQGAAAFEPAMMVAVLLYAHAVGVRSSRQIERMCGRDAGFRILAGNLRPDHATVARFLRRHRDGLSGLFTQALRLCHEAGLVRLGVVAVDGSRIAANASPHASRTEAGLDRQIAEAEVAFAEQAMALLDEHAGNDEAEDALFGAEQRGDELPAGLRRAGDRLDRLTAARDRLAEQRAAAERAQEAKQAAWQARKDAGVFPGRKPNDTAPQAATQRGRSPKANGTDPDCGRMRSKMTVIPGYNAQAAVTTNQIIVGQMVTTSSSDQDQLHPVLEATREQVARAGIDPVFSTVLADTGYATEDAFARGEQAGLHVLAPIPTQQRRHGEQAAVPRDLSRCPATARAQAKLHTLQGQWHYKLRSQTVEPVFGQIKQQQRLRQFSTRGLGNVEAEWSLACTVHNLRKLYQQHKNSRPN